MLKYILPGIAAIACATPVLAYNDAGNDPSIAQSAPMPGGGAGYPGTITCHQARPFLTPEQRAQRQALKQQRAAQRAAQGLPPKPHKVHARAC